MQISDLMGLIAGLSVFLLGMKQMSDSLEKVAGDRLKTLLGYLTKNKYLGLLTGTLFTAVIQSSSATTVMVVGFVNAGIMNLVQATPVILGANLGTCITAQILAFKITEYTPILIFIGVALTMFAKNRGKRFAGAFIGFGLIFLGLSLMSDAMAPLRDNQDFIKVISTFSNPFIGIFAGLIFTAIIQSSSASVGILQALAGQGIIGIGGAIYVIMGQNIGTCVTALLASINTSRNARRTAIIHLIFNVLTTFLVLLLVTFLPMQQWIEALSPGDAVRQIANAHIIFNVIGVIVFLPMTKLLAKVSTMIVRGEDPAPEKEALVYIDRRMLSTPIVALQQCTNEIERMASLAADNLRLAASTFINSDVSEIDKVYQNERVINYLEQEIISFLIELDKLDLPPADVDKIGTYFHVVNDIERIGDHAKNIIEYTAEAVEKKITLSGSGLTEAKAMCEKVSKLLDMAFKTFHERDMALLTSVYTLEEDVDDMEKELRRKHIERLTNGSCSPQAGMFFLDFAMNLERVGDHATNIAYSIAPAEDTETEEMVRVYKN